MLWLAVLAATAGSPSHDAFPPLRSGIGHPRAIALTRAGHVLIASARPNAVFELSAEGLRVLRVHAGPRDSTVPSAGRPEGEFAGIAACADGRVYLSAGREVLAYTPPDRWTSLAVAAATPALTRPAGLACDRDSRLVVADPGAHRVWRFDRRRATLVVLAGIGLPGDAGDGGPAASARLSSPESVAVTSDGTIFIADRGNRRIRSIRPDGRIVGTPRTAALADPTGVALIDRRTLAVVDAGAHRVYRLPLVSGKLHPIAGAGGEGFGGDGGPAVTARLRWPTTAAATADGALLVADGGNARVRRIARSGTISTIAGNGGFGWVGDGGPALAALVAPTGLALDRDGNLYVAEATHHRIRRIASQTGVITTLAGTGLEGHRGDGGPAAEAALRSPSTLAFGTDGTLYVGDTGNRRIRRISADGRIDTLTGGWNEDCCDTRSIVLHGERSLLIAEGDSLHRVRLPIGERSLVWSRKLTARNTVLQDGDLERVDALSVGSGEEVYVSSVRPGSVKRVDLATGKVETVLIEPPGERTPGPTTLAMAVPAGRLLFANPWGACLFSVDVVSRRVASVADLNALPGAQPRVQPGVTAVVTSGDAIYFADAWRVFRIGPSGVPEVVAGGGRGY